MRVADCSRFAVLPDVRAVLHKDQSVEVSASQGLAVMNEASSYAEHEECFSHGPTASLATVLGGDK